MSNKMVVQWFENGDTWEVVYEDGGNYVFRSQSKKACDEYVKKKSKEKFEKYNCYTHHGGDGRYIVAEVTSIDSVTNERWVSYIQHDGHKARFKDTYGDLLVEYTPENTNIIEEIHKLADEKAKIHSKIHDLDKSLTRLVRKVK